MHGLLHQPHATATAARSSLHHQRVTNACSLRLQGGVRLIRAVVPGNAGHPGITHQHFGARLVAHRPNRLRRWPDPHRTRLDHSLREIRVFRQKPIARVHRVGTRTPDRSDDGLDVQIGIARQHTTDSCTQIGFADVGTFTIGIGIHSDSFNAFEACRAHDTTGNLAPVGHQYPAKRALSRPDIDALADRICPARRHAIAPWVPCPT